MSDESEYTAEPQRRRLVTQTWQEPGPVHTGYWNIGRKATRADVEAWGASRGLALVTADDVPDTEEPGDTPPSWLLLKAALANQLAEDRAALMRVAKAVRPGTPWSEVEAALDALPEHIRREL